jgi:hypothetical protein
MINETQVGDPPPSHNNNYRIQTLAQLFGRAPICAPPPGREVPRRCSRCNSCQDQTLQDQRPNLLSENTGEQNVIDCLLGLITKGAGVWVGRATLCKVIHHPTPVVNGQPDEKIAALRGPTPPNPPPWGKFYGGHDLVV